MQLDPGDSETASDASTDGSGISSDSDSEALVSFHQEDSSMSFEEDCDEDSEDAMSIDTSSDSVLSNSSEDSDDSEDLSYLLYDENKDEDHDLELSMEQMLEKISGVLGERDEAEEMHALREWFILVFNLVLTCSLSVLLVYKAIKF